MSSRIPAYRTTARQRRAFSLVEVAISTLIVGTLMIAALQSLGASKRREADTTNRLLGQQLASDLMNEILLQDYQEPDSAVNPEFGPEPGEAIGNRANFDDVDDFVGWTATPPTSSSGNAIDGFTGWTHSVNVVWADPVTLQQTGSTHTGLKQITVTVTKNGQTLGSLVSYRSAGWVDTIPSPSDATDNHTPVAVATSPDLTRDVGQDVEFDASTSSDQDGDDISYVWNFGDGTTATGKTVVKVYSSPGNYTCTLTVYDGRGGVGNSSLTAVISP